MPSTVALLIGGEARTGKSTFKRHDPVTGALASEAAAATVADAIAAADAAEAAFPAWSARGPNERRAMLNRAALALESRAGDFVEAMMGEVGATEGWARFNLMLAASMIREAAALTTQIAGEVIPSDKPGCIALAMREPAGGVLGIAPWNAPIILGVRAIAVPLACGKAGIDAFTELRWITIETRPGHFPI
jgi:acyl-CoA reductase-like NAD-dependent aldehyde dehydrogenase